MRRLRGIVFFFFFCRPSKTFEVLLMLVYIHSECAKNDGKIVDRACRQTEKNICCCCT